MNKEQELLEKEFTANVKPKKVPLIESLALAMPKHIPEDVRLLNAVVGVGKLASMLRIKGIKENTNEVIPSNVYAILLIQSGSGKDRAIKTVDRLFKSIYKSIYKKIENEEIVRARKEAEYELGKDECERNSFAYKKFIRNIPSFTGTTGTPEGVCRGLYNFTNYSLGTKFFIETEFASALKTSGTISQSMKVLAEGYDNGYFEAKTVSGSSLAIPPIDGMNCSLFLFSDPYSLMTDSALKSKYIEEMTQRYARRSFFVYVPNDTREYVPQTFDEFMSGGNEEAEDEKKYMELFERFSGRINSNQFKQDIIIPSEVWRYHEFIVEYYNYKKNKIPERHQILRKSYQDVAWRGFKLAIGIAGIYNCEVLTREHINQGLYYAQKLFKSIEDFEKDINLETFERFAKYIDSNTYNEDKLEVKLSEMVKLGFISAKASKSQIDDLVMMTKPQLPRHTLEYNRELGIITAKAFRKDGELGVSVVRFPEGTSKEERIDKSKNGYKYINVSFKQLKNVLTNDCSFVPFKLKDGVLLKGNVLGGTRFLVFDVDNSEETYTEVADMLEDFTYHIATTSNSDNPYKFRILIELDGILDLDRDVWVNTMVSVAEYIGIPSDIDRLHKTQTTFGYKDSKVISNVAEPLSTKVVMDIATAHKANMMKKLENKNSTRRKTSSDVHKNYMSESEQFISIMLNGGGRNLSLYRAYKYFNDYTDDLDFIADTIIPYIYMKFIEFGGEEIGVSKFEKLQQQIREGR